MKSQHIRGRIDGKTGAGEFAEQIFCPYGPGRSGRPEQRTTGSHVLDPILEIGYINVLECDTEPAVVTPTFPPPGARYLPVRRAPFALQIFRFESRLIEIQIA